MASSFEKLLSDHSLIHTAKHAPKQSLLLKDYLRDDLSSCSSNGFKSLPRRQCCTTVGFFVDKKDLKIQSKRRNALPRQRSISALQRASEAVINAIKSSLPMSQKSGKKAKQAATCLLSRSFSRKLLSRSFWRKAANKEEGRSEGVPRRRSFRELIMQDGEGDKATSFDEDTVFAAPSITTSSSGCDSNSWGESEFTFASITTPSESSNENDLVDGTKEGAHHPKIQVSTKPEDNWSNEKEQFSPVSILDCPFEDEEESCKSHSNSNSTTCSILEGAKDKHMKKGRHFRFKSVTSLDPVVLEKRFGHSEQEDESHNPSTKQCSVLVPTMPTQNRNNNMCHDNNPNIEENARDLLNFVKRLTPSNCMVIKVENLLFDYFKQSIGENKNIDFSKKLQLCKVAEDWIHGQPQELYLGWEVQRGRLAYIREMDKCEEWKYPDQQVQQLALELENEVFTRLVDELVLDLTTHASQ